MIIWRERLANLHKALGRKPTTSELLDVAQIHQMTPEEIQEQHESFMRGMGPCEHGVYDFEDCGECRAKVKRI